MFQGYFSDPEPWPGEGVRIPGPVARRRTRIPVNVRPSVPVMTLQEQAQPHEPPLDELGDEEQPGPSSSPPPSDGVSLHEPIGNEGDERQRLRAALLELEEAKQRVARDAERARQQLRGELVADLLPLLDNFDRSLEAAQQSSDTGVYEGLRLVREQFEQVLAGYGLERIVTEGERFDPELHEAIAVADVSSDEDDGRVIREWQAGYRFGERVLRAAKVQVGKRV